LNDKFDEFVKEFKKVTDKQARQSYSLMPFDEFEKWLFYHADSLCYHRGIESPDYEDVNNMIRTKPYGDSSLYSQNSIWQFVHGHGDNYSITHRDYCCELAIRRRELSKENNLIQMKKM